MTQGLADRVHQVAARVLVDPAFAAEVRAAALAAVKGGSGSQAFRDYFEIFASTPGELASLGNLGEEGCACNSNTWFTLSSLAGPLYTCCATTTTTTTTGNFFGGATPEGGTR